MTVIVVTVPSAQVNFIVFIHQGIQFRTVLGDVAAHPCRPHHTEILKMQNFGVQSFKQSITSGFISYKHGPIQFRAIVHLPICHEQKLTSAAPVSYGIFIFWGVSLGQLIQPI